MNRFLLLLSTLVVVLLAGCSYQSRWDESMKKLAEDSTPEAVRQRGRESFHKKLAAIRDAPDSPRIVYVVEEKSTDAAAVLQYGASYRFKLDWYINYGSANISSVREEVENNIAQRRANRAYYGTTTHLYRVRAIDVTEQPWP